MNALRAGMIEDLQLHRLSKSTQLLYVREVRHLADYYRKPPDQITEEELRQYFLLNVKPVPDLLILQFSNDQTIKKGSVMLQSLA